MPKQYRSREGDITAVDTKSQLTTLGSETAPGPLLVPQGVSLLKGIIVAVMADGAAAGAGAFLLRLEGPGLPTGPEVVGVAAMGYDATSPQGLIRAQWVPLDVTVTPGNEILVFGEMVGADIGTATMGATLVFE